MLCHDNVIGVNIIIAELRLDTGQLLFRGEVKRMVSWHQLSQTLNKNRKINFVSFPSKRESLYDSCWHWISQLRQNDTICSTKVSVLLWVKSEGVRRGLRGIPPHTSPVSSSRHSLSSHSQKRPVTRPLLSSLSHMQLPQWQVPIEDNSFRDSSSQNPKNTSFFCSAIYSSRLLWFKLPSFGDNRQ